jgi:hypothetical protein
MRGARQLVPNLPNPKISNEYDRRASPLSISRSVPSRAISGAP